VSQIQALDRTQPGLPLKKGRAGTMTHDYKRNGTTTLFAALDVAAGTVIGECLARHRADEFLSFLKTIDRETPAHLDLHLILDNYATHKTPAVKRWLARHKRFTLHFTPTSCSWLNLVERLFAEITRQRIRRGTFNDVIELKIAIDEWIEHRNQNPKPFKWTASAKSILSICFVRKSQSLNVLDRYAKEKLIQANPSRHLPHHVTNLLATAALSACPPMRAGSRSSQGQSFS
jgi:transposase